MRFLSKIPLVLERVAGWLSREHRHGILNHISLILLYLEFEVHDLQNSTNGFFAIGLEYLFEVVGYII